MENPQKAVESIRKLLAESRTWTRPEQVGAYAAIKIMLRELDEYLEEEKPPAWGTTGSKVVSLNFHVDALFGMNEDNGKDPEQHHRWAFGDLDVIKRNIPAQG